MAEFTTSTLQTVATNQNILFSDTPVCSNNCSILHREGSGLVTLRGSVKQCRALYKVYFSGNIAIPEGGVAADPISVAIAINGKAIISSNAIVTPAVVEQFNNVSSVAFISVPAGCCTQISVENTSTQTIDVQNANLIVERIA